MIWARDVVFPIPPSPMRHMCLSVFLITSVSGASLSPSLACMENSALSRFSSAFGRIDSTISRPRNLLSLASRYHSLPFSHTSSLDRCLASCSRFITGVPKIRLYTCWKSTPSSFLKRDTIVSKVNLFSASSALSDSTSSTFVPWIRGSSAAENCPSYTIFIRDLLNSLVICSLVSDTFLYFR